MANRRIIVLLLSLAMIVSYTPCIAFATGEQADEENISIIEAPAPETITINNTEQLPDSVTLLENYMKQEAKNEMKSSGIKSRNSRGSKLQGNDRFAYNVLKAGIEKIAAGTTAFNAGSKAVAIKIIVK